AIYIPELKPLPPKPIEDKEPQVTAIARRLVEQALNGAVDSQLFTAESWQVISPNISTATSMLKSLGPLRSIQVLKPDEQPGIRSYRYRLVFDSASWQMEMLLTPDNKISGLRLRPE